MQLEGVITTRETIKVFILANDLYCLALQQNMLLVNNLGAFYAPINK